GYRLMTDLLGKGWPFPPDKRRPALPDGAEVFDGDPAGTDRPRRVLFRRGRRAPGGRVLGAAAGSRHGGRAFRARVMPRGLGAISSITLPEGGGELRSEVEQAVGEWCQTHMDAPLWRRK